ncbi:hypothetical protein Fmac_005465 [Flemingia macrophylla]|uniref:Uncharacterized protein n=1 Tax=Flemingia macrophylla TaxID=520843 RepID=A0ABD1NAJ5_9FABA
MFSLGIIVTMNDGFDEVKLIGEDLEGMKRDKKFNPKSSKLMMYSKPLIMQDELTRSKNGEKSKKTSPKPHSGTPTPVSGSLELEKHASGAPALVYSTPALEMPRKTPKIEEPCEPFLDKHVITPCMTLYPLDTKHPITSLDQSCQGSRSFVVEDTVLLFAIKTNPEINFYLSIIHTYIQLSSNPPICVIQTNIQVSINSSTCIYSGAHIADKAHNLDFQANSVQAILQVDLYLSSGPCLITASVQDLMR